MDEEQKAQVTQTVANAAREVDGVAGFHLGRSLLPASRRSGRVPGISVQSENGMTYVEVHLVVLYHPERYLPTLADDVRDRIRQRLSEMNVGTLGPVDVVLEDIVETNVSS